MIREKNFLIIVRKLYINILFKNKILKKSLQRNSTSFDKLNQLGGRHVKSIFFDLLNRPTFLNRLYIRFFFFSQSQFFHEMRQNTTHISRRSLLDKIRAVFPPRFWDTPRDHGASNSRLLASTSVCPPAQNLG